MDRGDPRMNLAVAARMNNPDLSLFECLTVGGFIYHSDNGALMDCESVTLTQRKNQLNRRIRRAKKNQTAGNKSSSSTGKRKASPSLATSNEEEQSSNGSLVLMGSVGPSSPATNKKGTTNDKFSPKAAKKQNRNAAAVFEQAYGPGFLPHRSTSLGASAVPQQQLSNHSDDTQTQAPTKALTGGKQSITAAAKLPQASFAASASSQATIEDTVLDAPLIPNLPNDTTSSQTSQCTTSTQVADPRHDLALTYFEREPHALYQRCMLSAGFRMDESQDMSSEAYRKFAFEAWKRECERLQALLAKYET
eukprot:Sro128_g061070.1 n/a (307) ;mRNA; f:20963-21964